MCIAHTLSFLLTIWHHFFLLLGVNVGTMRVGGGLSFLVAFIRDYIYVDVDVVGVREGTGADGLGG